jgi:hypothetical protein
MKQVQSILVTPEFLLENNAGVEVLFFLLFLLENNAIQFGHLVLSNWCVILKWPLGSEYLGFVCYSELAEELILEMVVCVNFLRNRSKMFSRVDISIIRFTACIDFFF